MTIAACGGDSAEVTALRASCEADSEMTPAECSCMIDKAQAELSEDQFALLSAIVQSGSGDAPEEPPADLSASDMTAVMTFAVEAQQECES